MIINYPVFASFFPLNILLAVDVAPSQQSDPNKKMTILINIEQPDIILVEDMNDINCLALILNVSCLLLIMPIFFFGFCPFAVW